MLKWILLNLFPSISHRELKIDYSRIYSIASPTKTNYRKDLRVKDLKSFNINKRAFVVLALDWCEKNLGKLNHGYTLKIHYTFSQTSGTYYYDSHLFVIRVWDNLELINLVEATVHEYIHYLQFKSSRIHRMSDKLREELGYLNNPYEIEARFVADKLKKICLNSLMDRINA
jgi:hypothetical protein